MRVNTKVRYGLRTILEIAGSEIGRGVLQKEISENQEISVGYLDAIIANLKSAGLIVNYSGKSSGYVLARPAEKISVYDVYRAFEPEVTLVNCTCPTDDCTRLNICPTTDYWFYLNQIIKNEMKKTMLSALIKKEKLTNV